MLSCPYEKQCTKILNEKQSELDKKRLEKLGTKKNLLYYIRSILIEQQKVEKPKCDSEGGCYIYNSIERNNYSAFLESNLYQEISSDLSKKDKVRKLGKLS